MNIYRCQTDFLVLVRFLLQSLEDLDTRLRKLNSRLFVIRGQPTDILPKLFRVITESSLFILQKFDLERNQLVLENSAKFQASLRIRSYLRKCMKVAFCTEGKTEINFSSCACQQYQKVRYCTSFHLCSVYWTWTSEHIHIYDHQWNISLNIAMAVLSQQMPSFKQSCFFFCQEWDVSSLAFEEDPEPFGKERDAAVCTLAQDAGVEVVIRTSHTLFNLQK